MKGRQTNIGLGLWGIAVIISSEKLRLCWYLVLLRDGEAADALSDKHCHQNFDFGVRENQGKRSKLF